MIVRIGGAGVCRTDLHVMEGLWRGIQDPRLPYTLGHENAGWVEEVGSSVTTLRTGDAVIVHPLDDRRGLPGLPSRRRHALRPQRASPA